MALWRTERGMILACNDTNLVLVSSQGSFWAGVRLFSSQDDAQRFARQASTWRAHLLFRP